MESATLRKWEAAARALEEDPGSPRMPLHVLLGEAVDVARFFQSYYETEVGPGNIEARPGLEQAVSGGQFREELGQEILELQEATQVAQTAYLLTVSRPESPMDRAQFVLGELRAALEFIFDDGVDDEDDVRVERLAQAHANALSQDAVALALEDYAGLAEMHRERIAELGAFEIGMIQEARELAANLRALSAERLAGTVNDEQRRALDLRNRLAALLHQRMQLVRAAARYVFRHHPDIAKRATSAYQRQRTARHRHAAAADAEGETNESATPVTEQEPASGSGELSESTL